MAPPFEGGGTIAGATAGASAAASARFLSCHSSAAVRIAKSADWRIVSGVTHLGEPIATPPCPAAQEQRKSRDTPHHVALLFNANKVYDREIISGIGAYLRSTRAEWDLFIEDDFRARLTSLAQWHGDGIIADYDDPAVSEALAGTKLPVVAVGGSYEDHADYPKGVPYVATDNFKLVKLAHDHLVEAGLPRIAMYSLPEAPGNRWAQEREKAFARLASEGNVYRGVQASVVEWNTAIEHLTEWIASLEKPVGIIAITDARARHLMQACTIASIPVPEQVCHCRHR